MLKVKNYINMGPAQYRKRKLSGSGFVILFTVTISAIILAIALGVENIALKEVKFGTNARDTNDAFFAADTGAECALSHDKTKPADNAFTGSANMSCSGNSIMLIPSGSPTSFWTFVISELGSTAQGCAKVTVDKTIPSKTVVTSKGYNIGSSDGSCTSSNPDRIERELTITY